MVKKKKKKKEKKRKKRKGSRPCRVMKTRIVLTRYTTLSKQPIGFTLDRSRSRRHPAKVNCDTYFADDIALLSNTLEQVQLLLLWVETSAQKIGLPVNNPKTV